MGTEARKLVLDGYPGKNVIACDLRDDFIKIGFKLFGDAGSCPITFITGDIFDVTLSIAQMEMTGTSQLRSISDLSQLKGRLQHIYAGALFHLFDEETQYAIATRLSVLLRRTPGSVIFGRHQGKEEAGSLEPGLGRYVASPIIKYCADRS